MSDISARTRDVQGELDLAASIRGSHGRDEIIRTTLRTDERVIARVTDGIYRQPASALRELISNSYDADATRVTITTDAPRFERISVEDNGHGMTPEVLAHLLNHIGGSAKRSDTGVNLGITDKLDPMRSPHGRRLIGKIGIGLFSVSQLTHSFQLITKVKGDDFRTVATVALRQYAEDDVPAEEEAKKDFEAGRVNVWRERAKDLDSHGTTIILTSIRTQARDTLRSRDIWSVIEDAEKGVLGDDRQVIDPPRFHMGRVDASGQLLQGLADQLTSVPWSPGDPPHKAFKKLVGAVWDQTEQGNPNPQLERLFDYYLRMAWQLSLSIPTAYVDGHPFDLPVNEFGAAFMLSNEYRGNAEPIRPKQGDTLRTACELSNPPASIGQFAVFFDELQLSRPLRFRDLPITEHALKKPLVFVGKCRESFARAPRELSGGPVGFEAYLFWTPKIAPTEHQGSLIRIHGSSGTLFDSTFMRYQVSEQTRLRQITCEIFVDEGLDSALNIDRESFNNAHPHSVFITKWLHGALRQLATSQKRIAAEAREHKLDEAKSAALTAIQRVAIETWREESDDPASTPPTIALTEGQLRPGGSSANADEYVFARETIVATPSGRRTAASKARAAVVEEKLRAVAQVLASFGLLERLTKRKQERLLRAIFDILDAPDE